MQGFLCGHRVCVLVFEGRPFKTECFFVRFKSRLTAVALDKVAHRLPPTAMAQPSQQPTARSMSVNRALAAFSGVTVRTSLSALPVFHGEVVCPLLTASTGA